MSALFERVGGFGERGLHELGVRLVLDLHCLESLGSAGSCWSLDRLRCREIDCLSEFGSGCDGIIVELADACGLRRLVAAKVSVVLTLVHVLLVPSDERAQVRVICPVEEEPLRLDLHRS
jgi:hypothetical protein